MLNTTAVLQRRRWQHAASQIIVGVFCVVASLTANAQAWGTHGMVVFGGREGLYASHLPMFHAPHNAQAVMRFHLRDSVNDSALRETIAQTPQLWTMEPEKFDLDRLMPGCGMPLNQFTARLVQGHFEQGGTERFANQSVVIDEVLLFRSLDASPRISSAGRYHVVGGGRERFLVKEIDRLPDFNLIVALKLLTERIPSWPTEVLLPARNLQAPTMRAWNNVLRKQLGQQAIVATVLYFETADLK